MSDDEYENDFVEESIAELVTSTLSIPDDNPIRTSSHSIQSDYGWNSSSPKASLQAKVDELEATVKQKDKELRMVQIRLRRVERELKESQSRSRNSNSSSGNGGGDGGGRPRQGRRAGGMFGSSSSSSSTSLSRFGSTSGDCTGGVGGAHKGKCREIPFEEIELGRQISGGGFCILYESKWMGITVAVKRIFDPVITKELKDEFNLEKQMLCSLQHPNIVQLLGAVSKPPSLCLVFEFMPRGSLFHVLHKSPIKMDAERAMFMCKQISQGMLFIQANGIVHRDLKTYNILADEYLTCKICDFGMSITLSELDSLRSTDLKADVSGTPPYMAPELWNRQHASFESDIYALGILFAEIWTREPPFDGLPANDVKQQVLSGNRPALNNSGGFRIPRAMRELIAQMIDATPKRRPPLQTVMKALSALTK